MNTGGVESTIENNIGKARRAAYSLMGAGFHGVNGISPMIAISIYNTYVLPILIYGLEALLPKDTALLPAETQHKRILTQLCSLPETVAGPTPFILAGTLPLMALIHKKALKLLGSILETRNELEMRIVRRQAILKEESSWVTRVMHILVAYNLPTLTALLESMPKRATWNTLVNKSVDDSWEERIKGQSRLYPSLRYLSTNQFKNGTIHPLITTIKNNQRDIYRGMIKLRLATGCYYLRSKAKPINQAPADRTCPVCKEEEETREHFILRCPALDHKRIPNMENCPIELPSTKNEMMKIIMDSTDQSTKQFLGDIPVEIFEFWSRRLCYNLHAYRSQLISNPTAKKNAHQQQK